MPPAVTPPLHLEGGLGVRSQRVGQDDGEPLAARADVRTSRRGAAGYRTRAVIVEGPHLQLQQGRRVHGWRYAAPLSHLFGNDFVFATKHD